MAIQVNGTTVIDNSRNLQNVQGIKTVGGQSILGSGDISTGSTPGTFSVGALWQNRKTGESGTFHKVLYGGGIWIIAKQADTIMTSTNASDWTTRNTNISQYYRQMYGIAYDGTTFVVMGESSRTANSTNGTSWTDRTGSDYGDMQNVCAGSTGNFAACGNSGNLIRSTNSGVSWSLVSTPTSNSLRGIAGDSSGNMVAVGDFGTIIQSSNNGSSWTLRLNTNSSLHNFNAVDTDGSGTFVAVGNDGALFYSTNYGVNWTSGNPQTPAYLFDVKYSGGDWIAVGSGGSLTTTTSVSSAWTSQAVTGTQTQLNGIGANGSGLWIACGNSATVVST